MCCKASEYSEKRYRNLMYYYLRIENVGGYVLIAIYLFICMRVTRITQKVLNRIT